jgi:hypothetical protein
MTARFHLLSLFLSLLGTVFFFSPPKVKGQTTIYCALHREYAWWSSNDPSVQGSACI